MEADQKDQSPVSPEDENSNCLTITDNSSNDSSQVRFRSKSSSSPAMSQAETSQHLPQQQHVQQNTHPVLTKTLSDQPTPLPFVPDNEVLNTLPVTGGEPTKASWKRRLSMKVTNMTGLSIKQKSPNSTKAFTAVPSQSNSAGFFIDQRKQRNGKNTQKSHPFPVLSAILNFKKAALAP